MAKKIKQLQIEGNIVESVTGTGVNNADPKNPILNIPAGVKVTGITITGTTLKTITLTLSDATTVSGQFTDLNDTYPTLTLTDLNTGTAVIPSVITAKVIADYVNSKLTTAVRYKGSKNTYAELPTTGNVIGDIWNIVTASPPNQINAGDNVAWNGTTWDNLSGYIDTSAFLTAEVDPTGVKSMAFSGTTTKTLTITLNNDTTRTATFADLNTTYTTGTAAALALGTSVTGELWSAKTLADWLGAYNFSARVPIPVNNDFVVVAGNISGSTVTIPNAIVGTLHGDVMVFLNGVKLPKASYSFSTTSLIINQTLLPTPIIATDEVSLYYTQKVA